MDIEAILEMYEDDYNPSSKVPGPRNMYKYAGIVTQGPNTGKHKYTDFYPKKTNGSFHEWFDSKEEMEEALQNRKEESGRGLSQEELTKKYKKYLTDENFKNWSDADDAAKKRIKQKFRYDKGLGYQKVGRTKINPKTVNLLEKKKPINPKTGLPYTQEEFINLTNGQKQKLVLRMKNKKKPSTWDKRLGYDYGKKDNKLLNYMKEAAKQQEKLPVKDRTFINVFEQDGKKFVGVRDVKANTLYTHVDYDLSKKGAKKGTVITSHPQVENPDSEFNVYRNAAEKFKYDSPDKLLKSYFSKYERVPTYNEIYNFFTMDRSAPTSTMSKHNALTLQHLDVIEKNPTSNFQLLTGLKNTEANKIINQLKRGEITEAKANYDLNKIGAGQEGYGVPKEKMTPGKGVGVAKRDAIKKFKDAYKVNPNIVKDMTKKLLIKLEAHGCKGNAAGGRILFSNGSPDGKITTCAKKGVAKLEKGLTNGFKNADDAVLARGILKSGRFLKDAVSLRGLFGPAALAFTALAEAGFVGYDMLSSGKSFRETIGDSLFNYVVKGTDYEIDSDEEFIKRLKNIKTGPSGLRDFSDEEIGKMQYFKETLKDMDRGFDLYNKLGVIQKNRDAMSMIPEDAFSESAFQLDFDKQEDAARADIQDYNRTGTPRRVTNYLLSDKATAGADAAKKAALLVKQDQLQDAGTGKWYQAGRGDDRRRREAIDTKFQLEQMYNPTELDEFGEYFISKPKSEQSYIMGLGYSEGGITGLRSKYEYKK